MGRVGIISALGFETRAFRQSRHIVMRRCRVGGEGSAGAVHALAEDGVDLIVSWGTAGGLSPLLYAGDLSVPERVLSGDGREIPTDRRWRDRFRTAAGEVENCRLRAGPLLHSSSILSSPDDKRTLGVATGAEAVDMESLAIGQACRELGLPFLVVRAILDQVDDPLPEGIGAAIAPDGSIRAASFLAGVACRPGQWRPLALLALRYVRARAALSVAAGVLVRCLGDDR